MSIKLSGCLFMAALLFHSCKKDEVSAQPAAIKTIEATDKKVAAETAVTLSNIFTDDMVIQRDKPIRIFGTAPAAGHKIAVKASWDPTLRQAITSGEFWELTVKASPANAEPQYIALLDNGKVIDTVTNILIGDVWVCSGQSNMWMPMGPVFIFPGAHNNKAEIAAANYPNIRHVSISENPENVPLEKLDGSTGWKVCSPATVSTLSATAYYFGLKLHTTLNVPIGLVVAAVSGTRCEQWTSAETLAGNATLNSYYGGNTKKSKLYNGMIHPLHKMTIKGFTWYQGEENVKDDIAANYTTLNKAMISNWRNAFGDAGLPFYLTQIAPFNFEENKVITWGKAANLREAQGNVRTLNTANAPVGMAVTTDIGQFNNIHPSAKKQVGDRLAALALNQTYKTGAPCLGPQFQSCKIDVSANTMTLTFKNAEGLTTRNGAAVNQDFYVAGANKVFYRAKATIVGDKVVLSHPRDMPVHFKVAAVRYGYNNLNEDNNINSTLQNQYGFPMEPFRTDSW